MIEHWQSAQRANINNYGLQTKPAATSSSRRCSSILWWKLKPNRFSLSFFPPSHFLLSFFLIQIIFISFYFRCMSHSSVFFFFFFFSAHFAIATYNNNFPLQLNKIPTAFHIELLYNPLLSFLHYCHAVWLVEFVFFAFAFFLFSIFIRSLYVLRVLLLL